MIELLIDLGNSRLKCATLENGNWNLVRLNSSDNANDAIQSLSQLKATKFSKIWISSVSSNETTALLNSVCGNLWYCDIYNVAIDQYQEYLASNYKLTELGVDRWLAMLSVAHQQASQLVVDLGTATTLDLLSSTGIHLGGYILPGITSMESALRRDTSITFNVDNMGHNTVLPNNTSTAVVMGVRNAVAALINQTLLITADKTDLILTGGAASELKAMYTDASFKKHLVLQGLAKLSRLEANQ